jgi:putative tricarboxylic transport membrane protein
VDRARAGGLAVAAALTALGLFFLLGARAIPGEEAYAGVGPRVFPTLIGAGLTAIGAALAVAVGRGREGHASGERDRAPVVWVVSGLVLATLTVERVGFPVAAAVLFALTARAFGSRRLPRDVAAGLALGVVVWLIFSRGLGVSLPGGPLG